MKKVFPFLMVLGVLSVVLAGCGGGDNGGGDKGAAPAKAGEKAPDAK